METLGRSGISLSSIYVPVLAAPKITFHFRSWALFSPCRTEPYSENESRCCPSLDTDYSLKICIQSFVINKFLHYFSGAFALYTFESTAQLQPPLDQADHRTHDTWHGRQSIQYVEQLQRYRLTDGISDGDAHQIIGHSTKVVKGCHPPPIVFYS
jgi:hypothetical protein